MKKSAGDSDPLVGKVIHDRFRIIAPIARGGMGAVYKAEQAPLGRLVAIKVLSPKHEEDKDPEFRKRFFLEAATVAKLSHPNTVTVFDYGQSENLYFIVMELLEGVTLKKAMKQAGAMAPTRVVHVMKQICRSLREAHRLGVIHRDMKPGNVMLLEQGDEKDYVKVLDFGLVKDVDAAEEDEDLTQAGVFMGSPKYMSPEQIQGERVDRRSDIYSLGVVMYEMLCGHPPFQRDKQVQILMDHINAPVPPMDVPEGRPPIPPELQQVVLKCLAKKREDRFDDMESLLVALKMVAGELSLPLPPSGEMGLTGEYMLGGTPVSGIHTLSADAMRTTSSGSISAPTITGTGSGPMTSSTSGQVPAMVASGSQPLERGGNKLAVALGVLALLAAAAVLVLVLDPFGSGQASTPTGSTGATAAQSPPETPPEPETETPPEVAPEVEEETTPEAPAPIRSVIVELDSRPSGAMVQIGDHEYGPTPAQVELTGEQAAPGAELTFVFTRDGHREMTVTRNVPREGNLEVSARLRRTWTAPRRGGGGSSDESPQETVTPAGYRDSPY
ncbi:MAG: serine/threonine-protein kinase [Myxococcota bacterium]|nr:serine/threonine-protein kinase [Myxococcota bacterium]